MSTLGDLKAQIAGDLDRNVAGAELTGEIADAITRAIKRYRHKRFWWTESRSLTFSTVADQTIYGVADHADIPNIIIIRYGFVTLGGNVIEMSRITWPDWEEGTDIASGQPWSWAHVAEQMFVYPTPDGAYTLRFQGNIQSAAPASDDEADNRWMTDGYDLIRAEAKRYLAAHVERDWEAAGFWEREAAGELHRLTAESHLKTDSGGVIVPTEF